MRPVIEKGRGGLNPQLTTLSHAPDAAYEFCPMHTWKCIGGLGNTKLLPSFLGLLSTKQYGSYPLLPSACILHHFFTVAQLQQNGWREVLPSTSSSDFGEESCCVLVLSCTQTVYFEHGYQIGLFSRAWWSKNVCLSASKCSRICVGGASASCLGNCEHCFENVKGSKRENKV